VHELQYQQWVCAPRQSYIWLVLDMTDSLFCHYGVCVPVTFADNNISKAWTLVHAVLLSMLQVESHLSHTSLTTRKLARSLTVFLLAYTTAYMETLTIAHVS